MASLARVTLLFAGLLLAVPAAHGQEEVQAVLSGRLLRAGVPADSGTVVLHRITSVEGGGVIESTSVGRDGSFSFRLPNLPVPGTHAFFVTTEYEGILYWGDPIGAAADLDSLYIVETFPTEIAPAGGVPFTVMAFDLTLDESPVGWRVTEAFILRNDDEVTYVPSDSLGAVWRFPLPTGAMGARVVEGEVGPAWGPVRFVGGAIVASNPIVPGLNFYMIQFEIESLDFDIELLGEVEQARVLVREPAPAVRVEGMAPFAPVEFEGGTYRPWAAEGVRNQVIRVRPGEEGESRAVAWFALGLALLLVGAGVWGVSRGGLGPAPAPALAGGVPGAVGPPGRLRKDILVEVARLDEAYMDAGEPDGDARERYLQRRARLLREVEAGAPTRVP